MCVDRTHYTSLSLSKAYFDSLRQHEPGLTPIFNRIFAILDEVSSFPHLLLVYRLDLEDKFLLGSAPCQIYLQLPHQSNRFAALLFYLII